MSCDSSELSDTSVNRVTAESTCATSFKPSCCTLNAPFGMAARNIDSIFLFHETDIAETIILILLRLGFFILTVFVKHWLLIV